LETNIDSVFVKHYINKYCGGNKVGIVRHETIEMENETERSQPDEEGEAGMFVHSLLKNKEQTSSGTE
jgi:hypothetical protein